MSLGLASISCWWRSHRGKGWAIMCDQQMRRSRSFQLSQHLHQHLTSFTWHQAKIDHTESTHYGGALQLYCDSISRHCAQCVDSLCDSTTVTVTVTAPWSCQRDWQRWVGRESGSISMSNATLCVHRPIRLLTATADYTTGPVCCLRWYTGRSHTPTACMHNRLNYQGLPAVPLCTLWFKKNAPTLADYNYNPVQSIVIIFSKLFVNDHKSCLVLKFSTSPHICCHYTLWNTVLYFAVITLLIARNAPTSNHHITSISVNFNNVCYAIWTYP